jgi:SAM-dependent methyltransferase
MTMRSSSGSTVGCLVRSKVWTRCRNGRRCALCCRTCAAKGSWIWAAASVGSAVGRGSRVPLKSRASMFRKRCWRAPWLLRRTERSSTPGPTWRGSRLAPEAFDLVYSSLALHYVEHLDRLMSAVHRSLTPGGSLVFSVEHPIFTAPAEPSWSLASAGRKTWPAEGYLNEGPRSTNWLAKGVIKQHRTLATYINMLLRLGFAIYRVEEWGPT